MRRSRARSHSRRDRYAMGLTHFDESGRARMVDVSAKADTAREATAAGAVRMRPETLAHIRQGSIAKGDVLAVAQVAGVMAAKQTPQMIPMCHTLLLTGVDLTFALEDIDAGEAKVTITATVRTVGKTGAEMEALAAVSIAALRFTTCARPWIARWKSTRCACCARAAARAATIDVRMRARVQVSHKPNSVPWRLAIATATIISLGRRLPAASSGQPGARRASHPRATELRRPPLPCMVLLRMGFTATDQSPGRW